MIKNKKAMPNGRQGFTLIELLIVIAIIGILASIVLVSLSSAREKAKIASFKAQAHSFQSAAILQCDSAAISATVPANPAVGTNYLGTRTIPANTATCASAGTTNCQSCGPTGSGNFRLTIASTTALAVSCTATIRDFGVNFAGC